MTSETQLAAFYTACLVSMVVPYIGSFLQAFVVIGCLFRKEFRSSLAPLFLLPSIAIFGLAIKLAVESTDALLNQNMSVDTPEAISLAVLWLLQFGLLLVLLLVQS